MGLGISAETFGVDLRTRTKVAGCKGEGDKEEVRREILMCQEKSKLPDKIHVDWCEEVAENWFWSQRECGGGQVVGIVPTERLKLRRRQEGVCLALSLRAGEKFERLRRTYPPWRRSFGRMVGGWANGRESSRKHAGSRSSKCRHGDK